MENTARAVIESYLSSQHAFFSTHATKDIRFRTANLRRLKNAILVYESRIAEALWADLHKTYQEAYLTEISIVLQEINNHIRHLKHWMKPKTVRTPIQLWPSQSKIIYEPLGVSLIIAPWNYPFQLMINPLVGAISAGCCAILKPSPYTPNVAKVMEEMITQTFKSDYIAVAQGNRDVNTILLEQRFDMIFFTGSPALGKTVMKAASQFLTPVVLELGGKSPCIVDSDADLHIAAKRIAWGKFINAGQTCIAPDYLLVHASVKEQLIALIISAIEKMHGNDPQNSRFYPRIVSREAVIRLEKLMKHGRIRYGGKTDTEQKYIAPTVIDDIHSDFPVMQEEIFGPVLPILEFEDFSEVLDFVNRNEKPLAFYYFGKRGKAMEVLMKTTSGGGCINDTLMHIANDHLPFGGVGNSGMNKYHGKESFLAFSNARSIVFTPTWIDPVFRYPPFRYFRLVKKII